MSHSLGQVVFHVDIDAFFCQVEQRKNPQLGTKPFAVQQHQDIIAVNYAARQAGVKKHMSPAQAREVLKRVGGCLVHVHTVEGGRISYEPYRQAGREVLQLLQRNAWASVVEKGSIDEAYLLFTGGPALRVDLSPEAARQMAQSLRSQLWEQLQLKASVGIARNKTMSKLASAAAKPDGMLLALSPGEVQALLQRTPASRLPQAGGKDSTAFAKAGIQSVADLQSWSEQQLRQDLGFTRDRAAQLAQWARGECSAAVAVRPPPKSLSVQMSLTPVPLPMHPSFQGRSVCDDPSSTGMLQPVEVHAETFTRRMRMLLAAMTGDLMGRICADSHEEDRWPANMILALNISWPPKQNRFVNKTCRFPASTLSSHPPTAPSEVATAATTSSTSAEQAPLAPLHQAMLSNATSLCAAATQGAPPGAKVVQTRASVA
ncbi:hypothetical protein WJX73_001735 [Symbiochloris irregularis]|uniref:UmuC domain-containing protein n=1 Tax=Symbiochloris irregularis TaxID=706552 RepID=A0AAW1NW84_9CHLO